jgi:hypothetical protein
MTEKIECSVEKTKVIFRKDRKSGEITAVFPEWTEHSWAYVTCYAHFGQHGTCSHEWYMTTSPATPDEYADLKAELERIDYVLDVRVRWTNRRVIS